MNKMLARSLAAGALCTAGISILSMIVVGLQGISGWAAVSLRSVGFSLMGLSLLFFLFFSNDCSEKEKDRIRALRETKGNGAAAAEICCQVLLSGVFFLLFYLAGNKQTNAFRLTFYGMCAVICAMILLHMEFPKGTWKALSWAAYLDLIGYSLYILTVSGYTRWTDLGGSIFPVAAEAAVGWIHLLGLLLAATEFRLDRKRAIAMVTIGGIFFLVSENTGYHLLANLSGWMMLSNLLESPRKTAKMMLSLFAGYIVFLGVGIHFGWMENKEFLVTYADWTPAYGMGHSNQPGLVLMCVALLVWYLWMTEHPWIAMLSFEAGALGIWKLTFSRTSAIIIAAFPLINWFTYFLRRKHCQRGFIPCVLVTILLPLLSLALMYWLPNQEMLSTKGTFFARFLYPYWTIQKYGLTLWGQIMGRPYVVDNAFLHLYVFYGIASYLVICGMVIWREITYFRNCQWRELTLLTMIMIYSFMENAVLYLPFGFALLLENNTGRRRK